MQKEPPGGVAVEPTDHGLGRSRGGLTTKIHLAVEQGQKPLSVVITAGQRGDSPQFQPVLEAIRVPRLGRGRPRRRPDRVRADKAYDSRRNRSYLRRRGIKGPSRSLPTAFATATSSVAESAGRRSSRPTTASGMPSSAGSIASNATGP
ncbi:transposase [Streptomyces sp. V4I8]|uniref:transposase n=1 Tax=Streptomyces sp. V4I8 TaxID=3156469 RepID=UPI0035157EA4